MQHDEQVEGQAPQTFPCAQCGAKLEFAPGTDHLECPYCGHKESIETDQKPVVEYDLHEGLAALKTAPAGQLSVGGKAVECQGCGAVAIVTAQAGRCAFCDSPTIVDANSDEEIFLPESLLPFAVEERQATEGFKAWVRSRWFAPNDLAKRARADGLDGAYLPYWTYDSDTTTRYTGSRGENYTETEFYTDSEGKQQTRTVTKTRWYPASGTVHVPFDDVLICASDSLPRKLVRKLEPWDLPSLQPYTAEYLSGFVAERYAVGLEAGFELAEERMEPEINVAIRRDIGGDSQRIYSTAIRHAHTRFKHLLLPLWISSFRYHDKVYRVLVNARTGEVVGERPYSWVKIAALVIAVLVVVTLVVLLYMSR